MRLGADNRWMKKPCIVYTATKTRAGFYGGNEWHNLFAKQHRRAFQNAATGERSGIFRSLSTIYLGGTKGGLFALRAPVAAQRQSRWKADLIPGRAGDQNTVCFRVRPRHSDHSGRSEERPIPQSDIIGEQIATQLPYQPKPGCGRPTLKRIASSKHSPEAHFSTTLTGFSCRAPNFGLFRAKPERDGDVSDRWRMEWGAEPPDPEDLLR